MNAASPRPAVTPFTGVPALRPAAQPSVPARVVSEIDLVMSELAGRTVLVRRLELSNGVTVYGRKGGGA